MLEAVGSGGGTIAAIVQFFGDPITHPVSASFMVAGVFFLAFLMISKIRYSSFKHLTLGRKSHLSILVIALLVALIFNYTRPTLFALALLYTGSGPVYRIYTLFRKKKPANELTLADSAQQD